MNGPWYIIVADTRSHCECGFHRYAEVDAETRTVSVNYRGNIRGAAEQLGEAIREIQMINLREKMPFHRMLARVPIRRYLRDDWRYHSFT